MDLPQCPFTKSAQISFSPRNIPFKFDIAATLLGLDMRFSMAPIKSLPIVLARWIMTQFRVQFANHEKETFKSSTAKRSRVLGLSSSAAERTSRAENPLWLESFFPDPFLSLWALVR